MGSGAGIVVTSVVGTHVGASVASLFVDVGSAIKGEGGLGVGIVGIDGTKTFGVSVGRGMSESTLSVVVLLLLLLFVLLVLLSWLLRTGGRKIIKNPRITVKVVTNTKSPRVVLS